MKKIFITFLAACLLWSCNNENKDKKVAHIITSANDTLQYHYDSVRVVSNNVVKLESNANGDSTSATVRYPIFDNDQINTYIMRQVFNYFDPKEKATSYEDVVSSFVRGYNEYYIENKDTFQTWNLSVDIHVLRQVHNYIAMRYTHSDYTGGAHGNTYISYLNYNPKTNTTITLDSLLLPNTKSELLTIAESIFRKNEKRSPSAPLEGRYFFENGKFSLPESFYVTKEGLEFIYNAYEIKAYAYGTTTLFIPNAQLKNLAKPNTILTPNADI